MFRFIVRRLLQLVPTLFGLTLLLFVWLHRLPGGPETSILGERGTPALRARSHNAAEMRPTRPSKRAATPRGGTAVSACGRMVVSQPA